MDADIEEAIDVVDAMIFTGDTMLDDEERAEFRLTLTRWHRKLKEWDRLSEELDLSD